MSKVYTEEELNKPIFNGKSIIEIANYLKQFLPFECPSITDYSNKLMYDYELGEITDSDFSYLLSEEYKERMKRLSVILQRMDETRERYVAGLNCGITHF